MEVLSEDDKSYRVRSLSPSGGIFTILKANIRVPPVTKLETVKLTDKERANYGGGQLVTNISNWRSGPIEILYAIDGTSKGMVRELRTNKKYPLEQNSLGRRDARPKDPQWHVHRLNPDRPERGGLAQQGVWARGSGPRYS